MKNILNNRITQQHRADITELERPPMGILTRTSATVSENHTLLL